MEDKLNEYLFNALSDTEKKQLFDALDNDEVLQKDFTKKLNLLSVVMMQENKGDAAYAKCKLHEFKSKTRKIFLRRIAVQAAKYAAVVLLTIGLFAVYRSFENRHVADTYASFEVPNGQRARLSLPDGTIVWLNAGSQLKYPSAFSKKNRNVYLDGEAYFEVTSDERNPFKVETSLMNVNVLGTKFNVKSYINEAMLVTLMEGKVALTERNGMSKLTLSPDEQAFISADAENIILTRQDEADNIKSWISGEFSYINQPLYAIVNDLERLYDVNISILDEKLAEELFTSRSTEKEDIVQILDRLKGTRELDYTKEGDQIMIFKR